MDQEKLNSFGKLGRSMIKRKYVVILVWIIILFLVLPIILNEKGVSSLQFGSPTDNTLESVKANNVIASQFPNSETNNSLVMVISTNNASSLNTQDFIDKLTQEIQSNHSITELENVTSIYSILILTLNQTNQATQAAYSHANLTYTLLYSVPAAYLVVWTTAYNQTETTVLIPALQQTNQAVSAVIANANMTINLLYSVPATYLNVWIQAYNQTQDIPTANSIAYNQTATILYQADPASFNQYTAPLLYAFNASWTLSFQNPATQNYTPIQRAAAASAQTDQQYISTALAGNSSAQNFASALTNTLTLQDYLTTSQTDNNAKLQGFSIQYIANTSGSSYQFVNAAYNLGNNPNTSTLATLATDIIWNPAKYSMGQDFISTFNNVAYNQTSTILRQADQSSYDQYTSHLLDLFNASWSQSFQNTTTNITPQQRATAASSQANQQYIKTYMNSTEDFGKGVAESCSLDDFLAGNSSKTNSLLQNFSIGFVSNSSGFSTELLNATYNLGENASSEAFKTLASNIVADPEAYNIGQELTSVVNSFVSPSKDLTLVSVVFNHSADKNLETVREILKSKLATTDDGVTSALVTGTQALNSDFSKSTNQDLELILPVTIALLLIATGLFFRSIITPLVTLGSIGVALGISQIFPYIVGTYINKIDFMIPVVLLTIIVGVGTDYSIFVIARHREERINGLPVHKAVLKSITWAGESIATSGTTVIISFLALAAASIVLLQTLGLVVGCGVIVALLVSLTFVPALVTLLGDRIFWPNTGARFQKYSESILQKNRVKSGYFARSGAFSVKHAKILVLIAIIITVPLFYVYVKQTPSYDFLGGAPANLESVIASKTLSSSFGGGRLFPTYVVVSFQDPLVNNGSLNLDELAIVGNISSQLASDAAIQQVIGPTMPYGTPITYANITQTSDLLTFSSIMQNIGADNKSALITLKFKVDPYSTEAINQAQQIRGSLHKNFDKTASVTGIYMGGTTGAMLDTKNVFVSQFNIILPIVAVGVAIVLFIVLGSLVLPIFAVISVLMSIVWTLAVTAIVFQSAFNYGLLFITPLMLFVLLLGLGMDYNIFILTRIREEALKGENLNEAITNAIQQTGGIITAAAIILAGSLGALFLSNNLILKEMGFAFLFSILIDALVVRTYLVPAVMSILGKWNWYNPIKRLRRLKEIDDKNTSTQ